MYGEIVTRLRYKPAEIQNTVLTINGTAAYLPINPQEIPFPVLSEYEYCTIFLESFETNKDTLYEVKYEIHYKWNDLLYKIGEVTSINGKAEFPKLIKGMSYYVTAIPLDGKYQSKQVRITLDEYDIRQEPVAITTYENSDYKNYEHYLILKNIFGDATVYLEGNPDYISLDRNDKNLRVYLNDANNPDYANFDLVIEDYREEDIIITKKNILVDVPPLPNKNIVFEVPYAILASKLGKDNIDNILNTNPTIGYVGALSVKPQKNSSNAILYTKDKNSDYNDVSNVEYSDILELKSPINEIDTQIEITGTINNTNNLILLNDELMGFISFDDTTKILTVKRGVLDTVPKKHNSGSLFVFDLPDVAFDSTQYAQSEVVEAQVLTTTPNSIQELSETGQSIEIQARAIRPYPPANVKFNGIYFPETHLITRDLVIEWVDRNRLQQTDGELLGFYDTGVTVEPVTAYSYELISEEIVLDSASDITTHNTPILSSVFAPDKPHTLRLWSVRDGYDSYQKFEHAFFVEAASLILTTTTNGSSVVGNTVPTANITVNVHESLIANMKFDGSSISGKAPAGAVITIEVNE